MIMPDNTDKVKAHISELAESCRIISGKSQNEGMFIPPTIIVNPPKDSRISKEETFGPVISVYSFDNDKKLIDRINTKGYGLSASIFGDDNKRMNFIASNNI